MGKRYAVLDKNGLVLNQIMLADPLRPGFYPGYGAALVPLEDADVSAGCKLDVHVMKVDPRQMPEVGDTLDLKTGKLTKAVPIVTQTTNELDEVITVLRIDTPVLKREVDPDAPKEVFDKSDVEVKK